MNSITKATKQNLSAGKTTEPRINNWRGNIQQQSRLTQVVPNLKEFGSFIE